MRLNLGCGRAQLPTVRGSQFHWHIEHYLPDSAYDTDAGWVNVDAVPQDGVDQVVDIFTYPWPFADNSVDEIWCSHIVEHIPHEVRFGPTIVGGIGYAPSDELYRAAKSDGFYAFFYEVWRVLKPDGLIHVVCPYAFSVGGMSDPQHRRYITTATFGYLAPQGDSAPFDYQIPLAFEAIADAQLRTRMSRPMTEAEFQASMWHNVNVIEELAITLRAVK